MKPTISSVTYNKLRKRLRRNTGRAIEHYNMIEDGDRIMVCLSGGKDSYTLLDILLALKASAPVDFELVAVNLDQGHPGFPQQILPEYCESINVKFHQISKDTYSVVKSIIPENKTMCSLCSRLRRGTLYGFAEEHGFNKIALGHHRDDIIETLFLNMFFGGHLKAMPAKLRSDDKKNTIIRPLAYCNEQDISKYAQYLDFPIIPCDLCGSQDSLQRQQIKNLLQDWDKQFPGRVESIFSSIQNVAPSQLMDRELFDFNTFERQSSAPVKSELNSWLMPTKDDDTNADSKKDLSKQDNKESAHQGSGVKIQVTKNTVPL